MDENRSGELISILKEAIEPFRKYMRGLRIQSWIKTIIVVIFAIQGIIFLSFKTMSGSSSSLSPSISTNSLNSDYPDKDFASKNVIAVIPVIGVISEGGGKGGIVETMAEMLDYAGKDPNVKAVILEVQSPGGGVNASNLIWNDIMKFKKSGKPLVAFFNGIAASGGYYISAPADKIIATPETLTGSIGVIMQSPDYSGLLGKVGVKFNTIKSGQQKDMMSPYKPLEKDTEMILQKLVDGAYDRFVKKVAVGRKMDEKKVRKIADGRIYDSEQALANGLIDQMGYMEDSFQTAKKLAGIKEASLVRYSRKADLFSGLFMKLNLDPLASVKQQILPSQPGLYYLWTGN